MLIIFNLKHKNIKTLENTWGLGGEETQRGNHAC